MNIYKTVQTMGHARFLDEKENRRNQSFADRKDMKKFHDALKTIYGPKSSVVTTLLSADGSTLLTDKESLKGGQNTLKVCSIDH